MHSTLVPAARRTALLLSILAVAACTDDPASPRAPAAPRGAVGDVYTVTNTDGGSAVGSLRWALSLATGGEIIRFAPDLAGDTIVLDTTLAISQGVTIEGPASEGVTLSGDNKWGVLRIATSDLVTLRNVSLANGSQQYAAGMIGGSGRVVFENGSITHMRAESFPAVIIAELTLINSTVSDNVGTAGGGSALFGARTLTLVNSTVANNSDYGVQAGTTLTLQNSVIVGGADGLSCDADNSGSTTVLLGHNISDDATCGPAGPAMTIGDPMLDTLADNGGPGLTHALEAGSPAIDAGTSCAVAVDQRHVERDAICDLGAFESIQPIDVSLTVDPTVMISHSNGWAVVTGTVNCSGPTSFELATLLQEEQKFGKATAIVQGSASTQMECGPITKPWSVLIAPTSGAFINGSGTASAETRDTEPRVTPASATSAVKLYYGRR
jgi:hypothetical protein